MRVQDNFFVRTAVETPKAHAAEVSSDSQQKVMPQRTKWDLLGSQELILSTWLHKLLENVTREPHLPT